MSALEVDIQNLRSQLAQRLREQNGSCAALLTATAAIETNGEAFSDI